METEADTEQGGFDPTLHPIDITTLEKGSTFDPVSMGLIPHPKQVGETNYGLRLLALVQQLIGQAEQRKIPMAFASSKGKVRVMTDAEAVDYFDRSNRAKLCGMGRNVSRLRSLIDRSKLDQEKLEFHARKTALWALRYQAAIKPLRTLETKEKSKQIEMAGKTPQNPNPFK